MTAATCELSLLPRRIFGEKPRQFAQAKKLRVVQLGSYPTANRGARTNLLTIHQRLLARGHESTVIDLSPFHHVTESGVYYPRSTFELGRLLWRTRADVLHFHIGSGLSLRKIALAALVNKLTEAKKVCTLHMGGHFNSSKGLRAARWSAAGLVLRRFDTLIAVNAEIAAFVERVGVRANRLHLITPFPRLRTSESVSFSDDIETFCRQHTPLIASVGEFEPGSDVPRQFDILGKVRERYPSAGLIAIGGGDLHFKYSFARTLHQECNHIELTGSLPEPAISELIQRSNVLLQTGRGNLESFAIREAHKVNTPVVEVAPSQLTDEADIEIESLHVLRSLQIARAQYEDAPAALTDGVDDVIRLYRQLAARREEPALAPAGFEWPSVDWGL